jgi:hypothetical protein
MRSRFIYRELKGYVILVVLYSSPLVRPLDSDLGAGCYFLANVVLV